MRYIPSTNLGELGEEAALYYAQYIRDLDVRSFVPRNGDRDRPVTGTSLFLTTKL